MLFKGMSMSIAADRILNGGLNVSLRTSLQQLQPFWVDKPPRLGKEEMGSKNRPKKNMGGRNSFGGFFKHIGKLLIQPVFSLPES